MQNTYRKGALSIINPLCVQWKICFSTLDTFCDLLSAYTMSVGVICMVRKNASCFGTRKQFLVPLTVGNFTYRLNATELWCLSSTTPEHSETNAENIHAIFMRHNCDNNFYLLFFLRVVQNAGEKPAANIAATPNKSVTSSSSSTTISPSSHSTNIFRNIFCMLIVLVNLKDLARRIS